MRDQTFREWDETILAWMAEKERRTQEEERKTQERRAQLAKAQARLEADAREAKAELAAQNAAARWHALAFGGAATTFLGLFGWVLWTVTHAH